MSQRTRWILLRGTVGVALAVLSVTVPRRVVRSLEVGASFFYEALWPILLGMLIAAPIESSSTRNAWRTSWAAKIPPPLQRPPGWAH